MYDGLHEPVPEADRPLEWAEDPPIGDEAEDEDHRHDGKDAGHVVQLAARLEKLPEVTQHDLEEMLTGGPNAAPAP